ncbi:MAG: hypothetical protein K8T90_18265 [Planctomycetes bacterium]|nr:hypothetical protein [Planctomycetota bacterium]
MIRSVLFRSRLVPTSSGTSPRALGRVLLGPARPLCSAEGRRERNRSSIVLSVALAALVLCLAACTPPAGSPEMADVDRLQAAAEKAPSAASYDALRYALLMAARTHENVHDAVGIAFQVRAQETQVRLAELVTDSAERGRLAYEVIDRVDELEKGDILRVYEEVLPGSAARMQACRAKAKTLTN